MFNFGIGSANGSIKSFNMYRTLLLIITLAYGLNSFAQKGIYDDLLVFYVDEKYEKCLAKAETYTQKESTRKDPLPYLYMSMSLYEMSKIEKFDEDYPKAFRNALKYAVKYRKKDKDVEYFSDYEDYWSELNHKCMETAENFVQEENWSKAKGYYKYMTSYDPGNVGAWILRIYTEIKLNMGREAELHALEMEKALADQGSVENLSPDKQELLRNALIIYGEDLYSAGRSDSARKVMDIGSDAFMENEEFKMVWDGMQ